MFEQENWRNFSCPKSANWKNAELKKLFSLLIYFFQLKEEIIFVELFQTGHF